MKPEVIVIGAGFAGAVAAERFANAAGKRAVWKTGASWRQHV
ncbi:MAG: hypothetical protein ACLSA6_14320 [Holdemania massiliensis]